MAIMKKIRSKPARKTRAAKTSEVGQAVIASLREVLSWQRGELTLKVTELPDRRRGRVTEIGDIDGIRNREPDQKDGHEQDAQRHDRAERR